MTVQKAMRRHINLGGLFRPLNAVRLIFYHTSDLGRFLDCLQYWRDKRMLKSVHIIRNASKGMHESLPKCFVCVFYKFAGTTKKYSQANCIKMYCTKVISADLRRDLVSGIKHPAEVD